MSGEELPLQKQLFREGALDVSFQSIWMKKGRPVATYSYFSDLIIRGDRTMYFKYSSSFGIRYTHKKRFVLQREFQTVETDFGSAQIKGNLERY